jgi:exo-beta-1,3-glucanase (GH17 family)
LYADEPDAALLHAALGAYAVDEPHESINEIYRSVLSHYRIENVNVELVGGFVVNSGRDRYVVEVANVLEPCKSVISAGGTAVGVVPLAHELWFNRLRGRNDRVDLIAKAVRCEPERHWEAFRLIEKRNALSDVSVKAVHELITITEAGDAR